jgi:hypothetical protein
LLFKKEGYSHWEEKIEDKSKIVILI